MSTPNDFRNSQYTIIYDISGTEDPTLIPIEAAPGTTYRLLRFGSPKLYQKLDEGKTTNWVDISSSTGINLGTGAQVLKNVIGNEFQFRSFKGTGGVTVSQTANEIVIAFTGSDTIDNVTCDASVAVGDLAVFVGGTIYKPTSNLNSIIPYGIAGVVMAKASPTECSILASGEVLGFFGLTPGLPLFIDSTGGYTHSCPATGNVQQLGFAIDSSRIVFNPKQVIRRI
jgi:hypothetical protein